jgi:hypothetical protein
VKLHPIPDTTFEQAIKQALGTLPPKAWQRVDGLMCEGVVLHLPDWRKRFARLRLWLMERRGEIESRKFRQFWPSCNGMKSYRLPQT